MKVLLRKLWTDDRGQDIAEYAVMLAGHPNTHNRHRAARRLQCQQRLLQCGECAAIRVRCGKAVG